MMSAFGVRMGLIAAFMLLSAGAGWAEMEVVVAPEAGATDKEIQAAIDTVVKAGGGRVVIKPGEQHLYRSDHHMANFVECIRSRRDPVAPVEAVHAATTATLIADTATRLGRKLKWDWRREQFINDDAANRMLSRAMRQPWHV